MVLIVFFIKVYFLFHPNPKRKLLWNKEGLLSISFLLVLKTLISNAGCFCELHEHKWIQHPISSVAAGYISISVPAKIMALIIHYQSKYA